MKLICNLMLVMIAAFFITSCQKELNFDVLDSLAAGTLKSDSTFDCLPSTISGVYQADSTLGSGNYIDIEVDVNSTGTYDIRTDTTNGYSFSGVGIFGVTGVNTVRLYGAGKPVTAGTDAFIIRFDSSFCTVDVTVLGPAATQAVYTFGGAGGFCSAALPGGIYMAGFATTSANTDTVNVDVTQPGDYNITTTSVNGISFSGSGTFTSTGSQSVILTAQGTPTAAGAFNYPVSGSGSSCSFSITFIPMAPPAVFTVGAGNCAATYNGTYEVGVPALGQVLINVTVTTPGIYNITTSVVNGISFSGTGLFSAAGPAGVLLVASGTPTVAGLASFTITGGASSCGFAVSVNPAATDFIRCDINGTTTTFNINAVASIDNSSGVDVLNIDGKNILGPIPSINLGVVASGGITQTTYTVNQIAAGNFTSCEYIDASNVDFFMGSDANNQSANPGFTIIITSLTASRIAGTFSGEVKENNGVGPATRTIANGVFDVPLQ